MDSRITRQIKKDQITLYIIVGISKLLKFATGCTLGLRAQALIPTCNAPISKIRGRHCNVYTQVSRSPHVYTLSIKVQQELREHDKAWYHTYANMKYKYKVIHDIIKYYTVHVYYIIIQSKSEIYNMYTKAHKQKEELVSEERGVWHEDRNRSVHSPRKAQSTVDGSTTIQAQNLNVQIQGIKTYNKKQQLPSGIAIRIGVRTQA